MNDNSARPRCHTVRGARLDANSCALSAAQQRPRHRRDRASPSCRWSALWVLIWAALDVGYWLSLLLAVPAAGFLVRLFMIQHDCGHGSFFRHRLANDWIGRVDRRADADALRFLAAHPRDPSCHVAAISTAAASATSTRSRCANIGRCSLLGPAALSPLSPSAGHVRHRPGLSVPAAAPAAGRADARRAGGPGSAPWRPMLAIAPSSAALIWLIGLKAFLLVHLPIMLLAASIGVWLFYVQHQFEDTSWDERRRAGTCMTRRCTAVRTTTCRRSCAGSPPISACITCITSAAAFRSTACGGAARPSGIARRRAADPVAELPLRAPGAVGRGPAPAGLVPGSRAAVRRAALGGASRYSRPSVQHHADRRSRKAADARRGGARPPRGQHLSAGGRRWCSSASASGSPMPWSTRARPTTACRRAAATATRSKRRSAERAISSIVTSMRRRWWRTCDAGGSHTHL